MTKGQAIRAFRAARERVARPSESCIVGSLRVRNDGYGRYSVTSPDGEIVVVRVSPNGLVSA